jgi:hypothetical protein
LSNTQFRSTHTSAMNCIILPRFPDWGDKFSLKKIKQADMAQYAKGMSCLIGKWST